MTSQLKVDRISPATGSEIIIDGFSGGGGGSPSAVQIFTSSGTWTNPGVSMIMVEVQGGGGSGVRASTATTQNSGGGGGYARKLIDVSSISTATVTIGAGGAGSTTIDGMGDDGGDSIWSDGTNTLTGSGGAKGSSTDYTPGLGGTDSGGDLNISGGMGGITTSPIGGFSFLGYSGQRQHYGSLVAGCDGVWGGGGATSRKECGRGGNGGDGVVIVTEYK